MTSRLLLPAACTVVVIALASACGGASESELFAPPGASEFGTQPGESSSGDDGTGPPSVSASSGGKSSSGGSSGGSSSSSGNSSSGGGKDAGTDAGWKSDGIHCGKGPGGGDQWCSPQTHVCCAERNFAQGLELSCAGSDPAACPTGTAIGCDDRTDCPSGQVCCGMLDQGGYTSVTCSASCNSAAGLQAARFCDPSAPVDECAEDGKKCEGSQSLPGYFVCKD